MPCKKCGLKGHNKRTCLKTINILDDLKIDSKKECVICFNYIKYTLETPCNHIFCSKCIFTNITYGNFECPLCRTLLVNPKPVILKKYKKHMRRLKTRIKDLEHRLLNHVDN